MMAKYTATILLVAVAIFWSPASARPSSTKFGEKLDPANREAIDEFSKKVMEVAQNLSEPYKTRVLAELKEAERKEWTSFDGYAGYFIGYLQGVIDEYAKDNYSRKRRAASFESYNALDEDFSEDIDKLFYQHYVDVLVEAAPSEYKSTLIQKYEKAVEKRYEDLDEFADKATKIFYDVTGIDLHRSEGE